MALINCEECSTEISDKAKACPRCGCPQEVIQNSINNPCFKCNHELDADPIICTKCGNKLVRKDLKTGGYRQPYGWEIRAHHRNLNENSSKHTSRQKPDLPRSIKTIPKLEKFSRSGEANANNKNLSDLIEYILSLIHI